MTDTDAYEILNNIPLTPNTIICGDFNARLGPNLMGDARWNSRGSKLMKWIRENNLTNLNRQLNLKGIPTFMRFKNGNIETSIIDYFISTFDPQHASMEIKTNLSFSDHKIMILNFDFTPTSMYTEEHRSIFQRKKWCIDKLSCPDSFNFYNERIQRNIHTTNIIPSLIKLVEWSKENFNNEQHNLDIETCESIEYYTGVLYDDILYKSLEEAVGQREHRNKSWKWFWNKSLQTIANTRQHYYKKWMRAPGVDKARWWSLLIKQRNLLKAEIKQARNKAFHQFCDDLDKAPNRQSIIKRIIHSKQNPAQSKHFSSPKGPLEAVKEMAEFYKQIYSGTNINSNLPNPTPFSSSSYSQNADTNYVCPINRKAIVESIKRLPRNKSPGCDHIVAEHLKPIMTPIATPINFLFQICWYTGYTSKMWRTAQVVPIFKKGDSEDPANYRPISLTSIFRKMFEDIIQDDLYEHTKIDIAQGGFKQQLCAVDQALCLDTLIQQFKQQHEKEPPVILQMDIRKAYDECDRQVIWNNLQQIPFPLLRILKNLFNEVEIQIINNNFQSDFFHPNTGVLQGSVLSPHLYSIFIDSLLTTVRNSQDIRTIVPTNNSQYYQYPTINTLLFADDVASIGTEQNIFNIIKAMEDHSITYGYRWSPKKCIVIKQPTPTIYRIYNTPIIYATSSIYLGIPFSQHGIDNQVFLETTHTATRTKMQQLHKIGVRHNAFSLPLSAHIYKTFIRPKIEYGLSIINFNKKQLTRLERIQDDCLRMIINGHRTTSVNALKVMLTTYLTWKHDGTP